MSVYVIEHDYHALHHSGGRHWSDLHFIVWHDIEGYGPNAAEGAGSWFENSASGGSSNYGCDTNSIQQYLSTLVIPWGAPYANTDGVHIEIAGKASWSEAQWMAEKSCLDRAAWLTAYIHKHAEANGVNIPLRLLTVAEAKARKRGIITHAIATSAFGGTHTDPGPHFPKLWVLDRAKHYAV